jgi:transcriptional antiterminator RfaH
VAWYAVQCKPSEGDRAFANLEYQGADCFYPKIQVEKVRKGKRVRVFEPLFKGYLFVNLSPEDHLWSRVRYTRGVSRVVAFCGKPAPIPDEVIEYVRASLRNINDAGGIKHGQMMKIQDGPFRGLDAVFQSYDGDERAIVLISFMQKQQRVTVPLAAVGSI